MNIRAFLEAQKSKPEQVSQRTTSSGPTVKDLLINAILKRISPPVAQAAPQPIQRTGPGFAGEPMLQPYSGGQSTYKNLGDVVPQEGRKNAEVGVPAIEKALKDQGINSKQALAYALATTQHETANRFAPVNEGWYNDEKYGYAPGFTGRSEAKKRGYGGGENYYGRGYIQLTHKENYERIGKKIGVDLAKNPELANDPEVAAKVLAAYFKERGVDKAINAGDYLAARRLINPDNKGELISKTTQSYLERLGVK